MGLDIMVRKIVHKKGAEKRKAKDNRDYFRLIDDSGNYKNNFPEWTKPFIDEITEKWYDWDKYKEETGIDVFKMTWLREEYSKDGCFMTLKNPEDEKNFTIDLKKIPTKKVKIKVIFYEEVGYQRKGLNSQFYDDYDDGKIGYFVWDLKELKRYKKDYCDRQHRYIYASGEKSDFIVTPKKDFQENIIDKFVQNECVVCFSW